jgi:hypothetical protein
LFCQTKVYQSTRFIPHFHRNGDDPREIHAVGNPKQVGTDSYDSIKSRLGWWGVATSTTTVLFTGVNSIEFETIWIF